MGCPLHRDPDTPQQPAGPPLPSISEPSRLRAEFFLNVKHGSTCGRVSRGSTAEKSRVAQASLLPCPRPWAFRTPCFVGAERACCGGNPPTGPRGAVSFSQLILESLHSFPRACRRILEQPQQARPLALNQWSCLLGEEEMGNLPSESFFFLHMLECSWRCSGLAPPVKGGQLCNQMKGRTAL